VIAAAGQVVLAVLRPHDSNLVLATVPVVDDPSVPLDVPEQARTLEESRLDPPPLDPPPDPVEEPPLDLDDEWIDEAPALPDRPEPLSLDPARMPRVTMPRRPAAVAQPPAPVPPAPEPATQPPDVASETAIVQEAPVIDAPRPVYPRRAIELALEGTVTLLALVKADGTVEACEVESSSGHALLDEAARAALKRWRFKPRVIDGIARPFTARVPFDFFIPD
jgi:protein TonB